MSLLAFELVGIVLGLRTATLIDSLLLSERDAVALAEVLIKVEGSLLVVHEPISGQTFVVNRDFLEDRASQRTVFIDVGKKEPVLLNQAPESFTLLLDQISSTSPSTSFLRLTLADESRPQDLIPLIGYLLDYTVAYCLDDSRDGRNCLGGVELTLIEATLIDDYGESYRLFSFSYPTSLAGSDPALNSSKLRPDIKYMLDSRLRGVERVTGKEGSRIEVTSRNVVLDQVAL